MVSVDLLICGRAATILQFVKSIISAKHNKTRGACTWMLLFFFPLELHLQHMKDPRIGVKWELQPLAFTRATATPYLSLVFDLHHSSRQPQVVNPLSRARDQTCNLMVN